jgi:hypothetical protein
MRLGLLASVLALGAACGRSEPLCAEPGDALTPELACAALDPARGYAEHLAARPLSGPPYQRFLEAWKSAAESDLAGVRAGLAAIVEQTAGADADVFEIARRRAHESWLVVHGRGALAGLEGPREHVRKHIGAWKVDDTHELVVSENDIEGWLRYGSLCREVQGGSALKVSMADKVGLYRAADRFYDEADLESRIAFVALGGAWLTMREAWLGASYEQQQAWIEDAPLPGPMFGTSHEYFDAVLAAGRAHTHADAWIDHFGALRTDPRP